MYTQLYKITSKYYVKTYCNGLRTLVLLLVCLTPQPTDPHRNQYIYIYIYIYIYKCINEYIRMCIHK